MIRTDLLRSVREYLALRRALGFKLYQETWLLPDFVGFLTAHGSAFITTDLAVRWAQQPTGASARWCAKRLGVVRCFAKHRRAFDPRTEVPPPDLIPYRAARPLPHLYTRAEIAALMREAGALRPAVMAATYETLLGLLASTGMRVGEVIALDDGDVDWGRSLLKVRHAKFQKHRLVPLHASTVAALRGYVAVRDRLCVRLGPWLFTSTVGTRVIHQNFLHVFRRLVRRAGVGDDRGRRPRLHDFRHTFAVDTLRDWYRSGVDVERRLFSMSTYLGHVSPTSTYWYLTATPELLALAGQRLESWRSRR
jgi:integrase/recombinase XerD